MRTHLKVVNKEVWLISLTFLCYFCYSTVGGDLTLIARNFVSLGLQSGLFEIPIIVFRTVHRIRGPCAIVVAANGNLFRSI